MYNIYKKGFLIENSLQYNKFVKETIFIGEVYIKFLISKNRIHLPLYLDLKDAAVDLLAEIFTLEKNIIVKFRRFFDEHFPVMLNETEFNNNFYGFIAKIIQNNLINLYRDHDPALNNIYRNIKEAALDLGYQINVHFTDKYIYKGSFDNCKPIPERDELYELINNSSLEKYVNITKSFIEELFSILLNNGKYAPAIRLSDIASLVKTFLTSSLFSALNHNHSDRIFSENIHLKLLLDNILNDYYDKLSKYVTKNDLPKNFQECMYNLINEVISDYRQGNARKSVLDLQKTYFNTDDKKLFYKVQYCIDILESDIAESLKEDIKLIG